MNLEKAHEFYLLVKAHFNPDEFNEFYDYFELTWLNLEEKDYVKFNLIYGLILINLISKIQEIKKL